MPEPAGLQSTTASRVLEARLSYTRIQRRAAPIESSHVDGRAMLSFAYRVLGMPTGLREGVLLENGDACPVSGLKEVAGAFGANLLKITRTAPEPAKPGTVRTEKSPGWTVVHRSTRARELLPLGPDYEATLASFGRHTRRNIRSARKLAADAGLRFTVSTAPSLISADRHAALARSTRPNGVRLRLSSRLEAFAEATGRPFRSVVRAPDGQIVSYACSYFGDPASAYLLYQLNDPAFNELSPSLLHRAHLLEWLAGRGCTEFIFVHGCSGILQHACVRQPLEELFLLRRCPAGYLAASPIALAKADSSLGRLVRAALRA